MKILKYILVTAFTAACITAFSQPKPAQTAKNIIDMIIKETGAQPIPNTVDVIKVGDPQTKVTGIVTCMFATMDVLKKAVEMNCNLIIAHEPLFYNHLDETKQFSSDQVYLDKKKY